MIHFWSASWDTVTKNWRKIYQWESSTHWRSFFFEIHRGNEIRHCSVDLALIQRKTDDGCLPDHFCLTSRHKSKFPRDNLWRETRASSWSRFKGWTSLDTWHGYCGFSLPSGPPVIFDPWIRRLIPITVIGWLCLFSLGALSKLEIYLVRRTIQ